jgi:TolB-like protein
MSPVTERLQRLVMHAFRGVPTEMTVDFGNGESTVVYGENGTGKSTIADALEWYFKGEIELLSHEGRQHAVRCVGGDGDGVTSVEVLTSGMLGGKVVFPDERTPDTFEALRRETVSSSIAVLPFVDMSPGKDQEYFCHGITEEIITSLTSVPGLQVISRTSAFAFQSKDLEVTEIGRRLRVATILEGSVRRSGDRVRVTAQLVNAEDGYHIWSKRFDRELSDVFVIQDEIAASILDEFRIRRDARPSERAPLNVPAHDAYLKGMCALNKWTDGAMRQAIIDFNQAIAEDADFAPAYAALAEAHIWFYSGLGILPAAETVPHARQAVDTALTLDANLAHAHKVRGLIAMNHDWDRRGAEQALTRALQLGPGSASAHLWNAWRLALLGSPIQGASRQDGLRLLPVIQRRLTIRESRFVDEVWPALPIELRFRVLNYGGVSE